MAAKKNVNEEQGTIADTSSAAQGPIDLRKELAKYLPEGVNVADVTKTGGLLPVYNSKAAFEKRWPAAAGKINRIEVLPIEDDDRPRVMIVLSDLTVATFGTVGPKHDQKIVEVPKGGEIMIGLSGNLRSNSELRRVLVDCANVYFGAFAVTGSMPIKNRPSDMWLVDAFIDMVRPVKREGRYTLPATYIQAMMRGELSALVEGKFPKTADGSEFDAATGEVKDRPALNQGASA